MDRGHVKMFSAHTPLYSFVQRVIVQVASNPSVVPRNGWKWLHWVLIIPAGDVLPCRGLISNISQRFCQSLSVNTFWNQSQLGTLAEYHVSFIYYRLTLDCRHSTLILPTSHGLCSHINGLTFRAGCILSIESGTTSVPRCYRQVTHNVIAAVDD